MKYPRLLTLILIITLIPSARCFAQELIKKEELPTGTIPPKVIMLDRVPPEGTIMINEGAGYTSTREVTLNLSAKDTGGVVVPSFERKLPFVTIYMSFANEDENFSTPEPFKSEKTWILSEGEGVKTVYVKFKDAAGNWSSPFSDTIVLDLSAPITEITKPQDGEWIGRE